MRNYIGLKAEDAKPKYNGLSDQDRCDIMNSPGSGTPIAGVTDIDDLKRWMLKQTPTSLITVMREYAAAGADAAAMAAAAGMVQLLDEGVARVNMHNQKAVAGLDALLAAGVITQQQRDEAEALGDIQRSIAQELGFDVIRPGHLKHARTL